MKLAEALVLRGDMIKKLHQLSSRMLRNAIVQDGDKPAEDPADLLSEYEQLSNELKCLIARINRTNSTTAFNGGVLSDALAERDVMRMRQTVYRDLAEEATVTRMVHTRSEIRFRPAIPGWPAPMRWSGFNLNA